MAARENWAGSMHAMYDDEELFTFSKNSTVAIKIRQRPNA